MATIEDLAERVERLLLRHEELQRTNALLEQQLAALTPERGAQSHRRLARAAAGRARADRIECRGRERSMKQMEVTILGQSYLLGCPDGGERDLLEAVANVDREMSAIRDGGKVKARE